jgi:hypothetical protein
LFDPTGLYKDKRANAAIVKAENIFVKNYPLPMTKGDCIEMLNYMLPRIQLSGSTGSTRAWRNKYFAIIAKLEHENIGNQEVQKQVASFKAQAKISTLGEVLIWYNALTGFAKGIIWFVLFYVIIGIISSIALVD